MSKADPVVDQAVEKYVQFHRLEPRDIGRFSSSFKIPDRMACVGAATHVLYRSDKVDPVTLRKPKAPRNYIHDHDHGVGCYLPLDEGDGAATVAVPYWIRETQALCLLGQCLGFRFRDEGGKLVRAEGTRPLPELYCTPDGRCLLVIQDKRHLLAAIWGGVLGVEARGIVG
jgi:hypothetical protein